VKKGYPVAIITGADSVSIKVRFNKLGVKDIYLSSATKRLDFNDFCEKNNLNPKNVLYMGDDLPDYEVLKMVGVPTCPLNAAEDIKSISSYISGVNGGEGCVRDVIEQVLRAQNKWLDNEAFVW